MKQKKATTIDHALAAAVLAFRGAFSDEEEANDSRPRSFRGTIERVKQ